MNNTWHILADQREAALTVRGTKLKERLSQSVKSLPPLSIGDDVVIQNQLGNQPLRWDRSGTVIKINKFDQYEVMTHGSRRIMLRNRKNLRQISLPKERLMIRAVRIWISIHLKHESKSKSKSIENF